MGTATADAPSTISSRRISRFSAGRPSVVAIRSSHPDDQVTRRLLPVLWYGALETSFWREQEMVRLLVVASVVLCLLPVMGRSADTMSYQGLLQNPDGTPKNGQVEI